jgi:EPS-associated MarR family transcriptional regulator
VTKHGGSVPDMSLPTIMLQQESHLKVLRILETNPQISQRELSEALGVSLGKTNYCLKALLDKGLIKIQNFRNSKNKLAYSYLLTPHGIEQKAHMTLRYLQKKTQEYDLLRLEITELKREIEK